MNYKKQHKQSGFSLVELSVVLMVIGVTLGGALTIATKKTESDKYKETDRKIKIIEKALDNFLVNNQRLPCPADASLAINNASFGMEGTPNPITKCAGANFNSGNADAGTVPVKTLGLPDDIMIDGWNRRMTYIVDFRFTNNVDTNLLCTSGDLSAICFKFVSEGSIIINNNSGNPNTTIAVYALISHGKNGYGGWKYVGSGTRMPASSDTDEQDNAGDDLTSTFNTTFVQKSETATFDDIVKYRTKSQITGEANTVIDKDICDAALFDPATNVCTGASNTTICEALATQVDDFCFQPPGLN